MKPIALMLPLAGLFLAPSAPAMADPPAPPAPTPAKPERMICKREVVVGSRLPGPRVCRTAADWKQETRDSQDMVEAIQRDTRVPGGT